MLDKAETGIGGFFRGVDLANADAAAEKLKVGARVTTSFAEERIGDVLDSWSLLRGHRVVGEHRLEAESSTSARVACK